MHAETQVKFAAYQRKVALLNGVSSVAVKFTVVPPVQTTLETKIQEAAPLLKRINVVPVRDKEGAKIGLGINGPVSSRTKTSTGNKRKTRDPHTLDEKGFRCEKTNCDTHLGYDTLDSWSMFEDFELRVRDLIIQQKASDRCMIGWNGTHVAEDTDLDEFPLLQDVNKGWLQHCREQAPQRWLHRIRTGGTDQAPTFRNEVRVGPGGDYENMDALVFDMIQLLEPWYRESTDLQVYVGRELMHDKYFPIINQSEKPTETIAAQTLMAQKRIGGLPASVEANFPANALAITSDKNLSIYWQAGALRRHMQDAPDEDCVKNFESSNDAYVIERLGKFAFAENIVIGDWSEPG